MGLILFSFLVTTVLVSTGFFFAFRKFSSSKNPLSNFYYWVAASLATPSVYIGVILVWFFISSSYERKPFDKVHWDENRDSRYVYVEDLVDSKKLIDLTSSQLINMLGEPDYENDSTMTFYLGYSPEHFLNMDPDWLETELIDGKVRSVQVRE